MYDARTRGYLSRCIADTFLAGAWNERALVERGRRGAASQNRQAVADFRGHLLGRIARVESFNPHRAAKLRREFARVDWGEQP